MECYSKILERAVQLTESEGFPGPHSFVFLTRYAALSGDRKLLRLVGNSLEQLDDMLVSPMLAYAYAEYYQASKKAFCEPAAEYILSRCQEGPMTVMALAKCAAAFCSEKYLAEAIEMAEECPVSFSGSGLSDLAFLALAYLELWRATAFEDYLQAAMKPAKFIRNNFHSLFRADEAYDVEIPSGNSAVAVLYDCLARITQEDEWVAASREQGRFISLLADKYPTACSFGLISLLAAEFGSSTVVCVLPGEEYPEELLSVIDFYAPTTEIIVKCNSNVEKPTFYILKDGAMEEVNLS